MAKRGKRKRGHYLLEWREATRVQLVLEKALGELRYNLNAFGHNEGGESYQPIVNELERVLQIVDHIKEEITGDEPKVRSKPQNRI